MSDRKPNMALMAFAQSTGAKAASAHVPPVRVRVSVPTRVEVHAGTDAAKPAPTHGDMFDHTIHSANAAVTIKGPQGTVKGLLLEMVRVEGGYVITLDTEEGPMNFLVTSEHAYRLGLVGRRRTQIGAPTIGSLACALIVDVDIHSRDAEAGATA